MKPLDAELCVTFFSSESAQLKETKSLSLRALADFIPEKHADSKMGLPWLKLARFGDRRTEKNCLRHDANIVNHSGFEIDCDGGPLSIDDAAALFKRHKLACVLYDSPSAATKPNRWRALFPFSCELTSRERLEIVEQMGALVPGLDMKSSRGASTSFLFGGVGDFKPRVLLIEGKFADKVELPRPDQSTMPERDESRSGRHFREALYAIRDGLTYEEHLDRLDAEVLEYASERRGEATKGEHDWERAGEQVAKASLADKFQSFDDGGDSNSLDESDFLSAAELAELQRPFDFLEGLLYEQQMSVVYGAPKVGKSFLILDMACAVGLGHSWAGRQCDARNVLVIPLEGRGTIIDRVRAWEIENKATCPLTFYPKPWNLTSAKDVKKIIRYVRKRQVGLVIIDTLSRAIPDADENSATDMGKAIRAADSICRAGAHVMFAHHANKTGAMRGSNALIGAPDLVLKLTRTGEQRMAAIEENRHGRDGEVLRFMLEPRRTDIVDARGKSVVSAVVKLEGEWFEDHDASEGTETAADDGDAVVVTAFERLKGRAELAVTRRALRAELRRIGWRDDLTNSDSWGRAFRRAAGELELA
jgi:hypothetical protein